MLVYKGITASFAEDKVITSKEREDLAKARRILDLSEVELGTIHANLARMEAIWDIEHGMLPVLHDVGIPLQRNERAHF